MHLREMTNDNLRRKVREISRGLNIPEDFLTGQIKEIVKESLREVLERIEKEE